MWLDKLSVESESRGKLLVWLAPCLASSSCIKILKALRCLHPLFPAHHVLTRCWFYELTVSNAFIALTGLDMLSLRPRLTQV